MACVTCPVTGLFVALWLPVPSTGRSRAARSLAARRFAFGILSAHADCRVGGESGEPSRRAVRSGRARLFD